MEFNLYYLFWVIERHDIQSLRWVNVQLLDGRLKKYSVKFFHRLHSWQTHFYYKTHFGMKSKRRQSLIFGWVGKDPVFRGGSGEINTLHQNKPLWSTLEWLMESYSETQPLLGSNPFQSRKSLLEETCVCFFRVTDYVKVLSVGVPGGSWNTHYAKVTVLDVPGVLVSWTESSSTDND